MASYVYTATGSATASANIATDKVRIATTTSAVQYTTSFPNVALTGTIVTSTSSPTVTGSGTAFLTEVAVGYWIGNTSGNTVGIVKSITSDTVLTLTANAAITINPTATARYNPYGVPYTVANANSQIIPANSTFNSVTVGQGNIISYLNVAGTAGAFSVTELGMPHLNTGTNGVKATPSNGGPLV